jgi:hemerythrin
MPVPWSEGYATGVERIDSQHRMIFQMAADFGETLEAGAGEGVYGSLLQSLDLYVRTHFSVEEGCMHRHQCPVAVDNREAHQRFMVVLQEFADRYGVVGYRATDAQRLVETLEAWLVQHICQIDVRLRDSVTPVSRA